MKDKNDIEIRVGHLIKRCGLVLYADGLKYKVSKKTWRISKVEDDKIFYTDESGQYVNLPLPKNEGAYIVVGDEDGLFPEHLPAEDVVTIKAGGVQEKYRVHGEVEQYGWQDGDIVAISGQIGKETIDSGKLEKVPNTLEHKHVLIVADPIKVFGNSN